MINKSARLTSMIEQAKIKEAKVDFSEVNVSRAKDLIQIKIGKVGDGEECLSLFIPNENFNNFLKKLNGYHFRNCREIETQPEGDFKELFLHNTP